MSYKFDLVLQKGPHEKFDTVVLDAAPNKGSMIQCCGASWRVIDWVWGPNLVSDARLSSGLICVEKV